MSTFTALMIAQTVTSAVLVLAAAVLERAVGLQGMIWSVFVGTLLYGLPTAYVDLQQARLRTKTPFGLVQGFYRAGMGKFVLTLCGFALVFSQGSIEHAEGIFIAYLAMWLAHTATYLMLERTRS